MAGVWFSGPVAEAVKTVTEKNLVFLVYLYDDSEDSKQLDSVFQDENVPRDSYEREDDCFEDAKGFPRGQTIRPTVYEHIQCVALFMP
ncbi:hypothetical protein G6F42_016119 [Rhizopus arrhizus]|nr:hypothetical protein G6F42_016119 [Rhizopus arrhizus]